jgi:hypothetical protein
MWRARMLFVLSAPPFGGERATVDGMSRIVCLSLLLFGCGESKQSGKKPAGTSSDPVEICERVADVCRIDKAKLGVCTQKRGGSGFACASQH